MEASVKSSLERYGIAVAAAAVGVALRLILTPLISDQTLFITLTPAVAVSSLYAGFRAGMVTTLLGAASLQFLMMEPALSFTATHPTQISELVIFLLVGTFVSWVAADRRRKVTALKLTEAEAEARTQAAAEALRESEERLAVAQSSLGVGIWEWELATGKVTWSEGMYHLLGIERDGSDTTIEYWEEFILPEDRDTARNSILELIDEGSPNFYGEFRIRRRSDGRIRWAATQGRIVRENGTAVRLLGVNFDITETKDTEIKIQSLNRELNRRIRELQTIIELTPVGLAVATDATCDTIIANPALAKLVGMQPGDNVSVNDQRLPYRHLKDGVEMRAGELPMQRAIAEKRPIVDEEIDIERADGTIVSIYGYAAPVFDDDENVIGCVAAQVDITERKRYELERERKLGEEQDLRQQAEDASRLKDEFLATVSHELRTPLNSITGWAALLNDPTLPEQARTRAIDAIERGAKAQSQLIEDLLDVSRIITGKLHLSLGTVRVGEVIAAAAEIVRPAAEAKHIDLHVNAGSEPLYVNGDADRLQQVVWNLLSNAVKFTPSGGSVDVSLSGRDDQLQITVADTGKGIDENFLPFVFDRFRQADGSITRKYSGLGLGLAIVRHLVELHGGTVDVESEGEGRGSVFTVSLPAASAANGRPAPDVKAYAESISLGGVRILVVDDEDDTREALKLAFARSGASVETAASAAEALEIIRLHPTDVIVSDIGMPEQDGYSLLKDVRAWERESFREPVPAIALTAYARISDRDDALAAGYDRHVAKPVEPSRLAGMISELVKSRNALQES